MFSTGTKTGTETTNLSDKAPIHHEEVIGEEVRAEVDGDKAPLDGDDGVICSLLLSPFLRHDGMDALIHLVPVKKELSFWAARAGIKGYLDSMIRRTPLLEGTHRDRDCIVSILVRKCELEARFSTPVIVVCACAFHGLVCARLRSTRPASRAVNAGSEGR